jgi:hypothetical protein
VAGGKRVPLLFRSKASLLLNEYRCSLEGIKPPAFEAGYCHQLPRLVMCGAVPLMPYVNREKFLNWIRIAQCCIGLVRIVVASD